MCNPSPRIVCNLSPDRTEGRRSDGEGDAGSGFVDFAVGVQGPGSIAFDGELPGDSRDHTARAADIAVEQTAGSRPNAEN